MYLLKYIYKIKTKLSFDNLKLRVKLNLVLVLIFILTVASCASLLSHVLEKRAEQEVKNKAFLAIEMMGSVRNYTSEQIQPELNDRLTVETNFLPQTVPAYSAREVFERLKENSDYRDFSYKEATLNPTNLKDKADKFEAGIVNKFRNNEQLKQITGFQLRGNKKLYYVARPLKVDKISCLQCHSLPETAPKSLINTYGDSNGFNWRLNEIVAAQMVSVPASEIFSVTNRLQWSIVGIVAFCFAIAVMTINIFLINSIIRPLKKISDLSNEVSKGNSTAEYSHFALDEIGILVKALNRMRASLEMAMEKLERNSS